MANFDYLGQQAKLTELQALAQALAAKQANPQPMGQMVGKYFIPNYGGQIAQGLDSISEAKVSHDLPGQIAQFTAGTRAATGEATKQFMDLYKTDPAAAIAQAQGSPLPGMADAAKVGIQNQLKRFSPQHSRDYVQGKPGDQFYGVDATGKTDWTKPVRIIPFGPKVTGPDQEINYDTRGAVDNSQPNGLAGELPLPGLAGGAQSAGVRMTDKQIAARKGLTAETQSIRGEVPKRIIKNFDEVNTNDRPRVESLTRALDLLDSGTYSGVGSPVEQFLARMGQMVGMPYDPKLVSTQQYRAAVLQALSGKLGVAVSDADRKVEEVANGADLNMELQALKGIVAQKLVGHFNNIAAHNAYVEGSGIDDPGFMQNHTINLDIPFAWMEAHGIKQDPKSGGFAYKPPGAQPAPQQGAQPAAPASQAPSGKTFNVTTDEEYHEAMKQAKPGDIIQTPSGAFPVK